MKTNKGFISTGLLIAIIAVVLVGGGYAVWKTRSMNKAAAVIDTKGAGTNQETGKKVPFSKFIKQKGSYECTVHQLVNNMDTKGKVYLDNGKIRGNFNTEYNGAEISVNAIIKDGFAYTWTSFYPTGFKIAVKEDADGNLQGDVTASGAAYSWNSNKIGDYDCVPWTVDATEFDVPTNITFQEAK